MPGVLKGQAGTGSAMDRTRFITASGAGSAATGRTRGQPPPEDPRRLAGPDVPQPPVVVPPLSTLISHVMRAYPSHLPGRRITDPSGRRLIAGCDDSVKRSLTADIMARAREIVLVMGREDNSPVRVRCDERPAVRREPRWGDGS